jgi:antitoxin component YwqK of YwqJK toxin-antitoxin module
MASFNASRESARDTGRVSTSTDPIPHAETFDNGNVKLRGSHLDGEMHGAWEFFRRDGSLMRSGSFDRGRQIGVWRTYDRSGAVVKATDFGSDSG